MSEIHLRMSEAAAEGEGQDAAELAKLLLEEKLREEARWEPRSSPYTSTRYADQMPEADFYGYGLDTEYGEG